MTKAYIAGPITGRPLFNYPLFDEASMVVRQVGWTPVNPADLDRQAGVQPNDSVEYRRQAFQRDIPALLDCDVIVMLDGWEMSAGASLEYDLARELGLEIYHYSNFKFTFDSITSPPSVLTEADGLINGPRQQSYSHPSEDYGRTVAMFNAWRGDGAGSLSIEEGVAFMVMCKLSRQRHRHKRDNLTDAAGYIGCWAKVVGEDD